MTETTLAAFESDIAELFTEHVQAYTDHLFDEIRRLRNQDLDIGVGLRTTGEKYQGEMELELTVDGKVGRMYLSKDSWLAIGRLSQWIDD